MKHIFDIISKEVGKIGTGRLSIVVAFFAAILCNMGCTLSMEEWEVPEEDKGKYEPCVIENDTFKIRYQYNDNVYPFTVNVQKYIVDVQDSVIFISDNIPQKWMPKVGSYVAAGCSRTLPHGLNDRVTSIERVNGMYKMTVTPVSTGEVYKELKYTCDLDYDVPNVEELVDSNDIAEGDTILRYTDWAVTDPELREAKTRADKTDEESFSMCFDTRVASDGDEGSNKALIKAFKKDIAKHFSAFGSYNPYFRINYSKEVKLKIHEEADEDRKYKNSYTDKTEITDWAFELGMEGIVGGGKTWTPGGEKSLDRNVWKNAFKDKEKLKKLIPFSKKFKSNSKNKLMGAEVSVPVVGCPFPLEIVVEISIKVDLTINGAVGYHSRSVTKTRTGSETLDDEELNKWENEKIALTPEEKAKNVDEVFFMGYFDLGIEGRFGVGCLACKTAKVTVGFNLKGGVEGKYTAASGDDGVYAEDNTYIRPYIKVWGDITLDITFLGFTVWDKTFKIKETYLVGSGKTPYHPQISVPNIPGRMNDEHEVTFNYSPKKSSYGHETYYPFFALFKNTTEAKNMVMDSPIESVTSEFAPQRLPLAYDTEYTFKYKIPDDKFESKAIYYAVPVIYDMDTQQYIYYTYMAAPITSPNPEINVTDFYQSQGEQFCGEFDFTAQDELVEFMSESGEKSVDMDVNNSNLAKYKFVIKANILNRNLMRLVGFFINLHCNGKRVLKKTHFVYEQVKKTGAYTFEYSFVSNNQGDYPMYVEILPFYVDYDSEDMHLTFKAAGSGWFIHFNYPIKAKSTPKGAIKSEL